MIAYTIKHHVPGRIRIEIAGLKNMNMEALRKLGEIVTQKWRVEGIRDFGANPVTGSIIFKYDPAVLNIASYLNKMASDREINLIIGKGE